ncbi:MAG: protein kinase [Chthoniobacterales bacterium]|nr:protein kinase [Chthoniobacterales bacterium]
MAPVATAESTTCAGCGAALDAAASADFGCMVCMLHLAFERSAAVSEVEHLGQYVIEKREDGRPWELGRGAMGVTYRALDTSLRRTVALKLIKADFAGHGSDTRERFMREARAAAALRHPNVATVYQSGIDEESGQCFYAMELVEGETLEERVRRSGPLDMPSVIEIARQIAAALAAAEKRGLVHRDLKPANVMLATADESDQATPPGVAAPAAASAWRKTLRLTQPPLDKPASVVVKVIDFGLAKALAETPDARALTRGEFIGTPAFASPEQFTNKSVDVRSDIYSLGATLWYLLTGRMPFGDRILGKTEGRAGVVRPPIEQLKAAGVSARFTSLLVSMLALEPAARPGVNELSRKLEAIQKPKRAARLLGVAAVLAVLVAYFAAPFRISPKSGGAAAEKSIAVLPFEDLSTDNTNAFFASGIQEDVLVGLAKIADLKVISRNSVMQYRGTGRDLREIGRALGVKAILEGSVRRNGTRARINVQLISADDGAQIWAENYEREMRDAFALQSEVALRIASALKANLSALESARLQQAPTKNSDAYLRFIEAKNLYEDYRKLQPDLEKAERLYEEAIALDPGFALAYARLSQVENMYHEMYDHTPARREKARAAAHEALRLQPDLPEAHMALANDYWRANSSTGEIDYEKALAEFAIAQRGLPNDAEICGLIGQVQRHQGKWAESTEQFKRAVSLDPNSVERWHRLFYNYELTKNYRAADEASSTRSRSRRHRASGDTESTAPFCTCFGRAT